MTEAFVAPVAPPSTSEVLNDPEALFRIGRTTPAPVGGGFDVPMRLGPWTTGPDGGQSVGALGVMVDNALGNTVFAIRQKGLHSVTTELSLDVVAPPPWPGEHLRARSRLLGRDVTGGLAVCDVVDQSGQLVATGTARCRFVPLLPGGEAGRSVQPPRQRAGLASVVDTLGGRIEHADGFCRLVVPGSAALDNGSRSVHGGILFAGSEVAAAALAQDTQREQTSSVRMNFIRRAKLEQVVFTAEVVHRGRSISVYRVTSSNPAGKPCTVASVTRLRAAPGVST